jgi:type 1 glutamine amidotransferase
VTASHNSWLLTLVGESKMPPAKVQPKIDDQQKKDFISFIHDDGKASIGVHSATITFTQWPEYGDMIDDYFNEHPWGTFQVPIIVEDPNFPGMSQWPHEFTMTDEIYQMKDFSRDKCRVLMRLDASKLDLTNPRVHRRLLAALPLAVIDAPDSVINGATSRIPPHSHP